MNCFCQAKAAFQPGSVAKLDLPRTRLSLMASDHLPLVADLRVEF